MKKHKIHKTESATPGRDPHAHSSHHAANKEHGTGFHPGDEDEYCGPSECAGSMGKGRSGKQSAYKGESGNEKHEKDETPKHAID